MGDRAPRRRGLGSRAAAAVAAAGSLFLIGSSCTSVLGLDGQQEASAALCTKLEDCYSAGGPSSCQSRVDGSLAAASSTDRGGWLADFSSDTCLADCASARRCLDLQPVCLPHLSRCSAQDDCCDFVSGDEDCVGGFCCRTEGVRCTTDDDCCSNAGYCLAPDPDHPSDTYCGAVVCHAAGQACSFDAQCCSKVCANMICASDICGANGFDCTLDTDCCSGHCEAGGTCGTSCAPVGGVCTRSADCCSGVPCYAPKGADTGFCSSCEGAPLGVHCATDADCCAGLVCDPTFFACSKQCAAPGATCSTGADCCSGSCTDTGVCASTCSSTYCSVDSDCCSGSCVGSTCLLPCGGATCDHEPCIEGAPLGASCSVFGSCVAAVCDKDSYCCCTAWDTLCITEAAMDTTCAGVCE